MNVNQGLVLVAPRNPPVLDASFRPAILANRAFREQVRASGKPVPVRLALEQSETAVSHFTTQVLPEEHPQAAGNFIYLERIARLLLWSRGGFRFHFDGPPELAARLAAYYRETPTGKFDSNIVGERMFDHPIEVIHTTNLPPERRPAASLGRHLEGCRIGFDLGGSDRKVAAVIDGKVVFSEETVWDPYFQPDPQYHFDGIMDSLRKAAAHLPRVDAIGGSAAGIYVGNQVKVASLFRGVAPDVFDRRVKNLFLEVRKAWNNVPFEVVNDGEVTESIFLADYPSAVKAGVQFPPGLGSVLGELLEGRVLQHFPELVHPAHEATAVHELPDQMKQILGHRRAQLRMIQELRDIEAHDAVARQERGDADDGH